MSENTTPEILPALTEKSTIADIKSHLQKYHGFVIYRGVRKDELLFKHRVVHAETAEALEPLYQERFPSMRPEERAQRVASQMERNAENNTRMIPHAHESELLAEPTDQRLLDILKDPDKPLPNTPLTVSERKVLKDLIDNDFRALLRELEQFALEARAAQENEIITEYADKTMAMNAITSEYSELLNRQYIERVDFANAQRELGYAPGPVYAPSGTNLSLRVVGKEEAMRRALADYENAIRTARNAVETQRLNAQRRVLLAGLTPAAREMLNDIPDAKTMMIQAQVSTEQIEASK
jgi:hypothetical protein